MTETERQFVELYHKVSDKEKEIEGLKKQIDKLEKEKRGCRIETGFAQAEIVRVRRYVESVSIENEELREVIEMKDKKIERLERWLLVYKKALGK